jgi:hypothetical protein
MAIKVKYEREELINFIETRETDAKAVHPNDPVEAILTKVGFSRRRSEVRLHSLLPPRLIEVRDIREALFRWFELESVCSFGSQPVAKLLEYCPA